MDVTASQATGGDRRNFNGWSTGETSSNNQNNRGNQMTHGDQSFPVRMWVEDYVVPTTVDLKC